MDLQQAIAQAHDELLVTTIEDIQTTTAITWAGRAIASYNFYWETGSLKHLSNAEEFAHEALEHAALVPDPSLLDSLRPQLLHAAAEAKERQPLSP